MKNEFEMFYDDNGYELKISCNGYKIACICFDDEDSELPIKSKEQAERIALKFANILDNELEDVNFVNYPCELKFPYGTEFVDGFEGEAYSSEAEEEAAIVGKFCEALMSD